ncbi:uncharacterized protein LOC129872646 [Solanum dulcamara]|uniref:uncharacterized protein LOC129872646 n=1 Tax=Solanum dulcamara TaxID=45834 RepID=UPI0024861DD9|nr:uncharacterized protein LOC129872646 [Solanum dulcamara]
MDPPDGPDKARLEGQQVPPKEANQPTKSIAAKNSYANTLCSSSFSPHNQNAKESQLYCSKLQITMVSWLRSVNSQLLAGFLNLDPKLTKFDQNLRNWSPSKDQQRSGFTTISICFLISQMRRTSMRFGSNGLLKSRGSKCGFKSGRRTSRRRLADSSDEDNNKLIASPTLEEIKNAVFSMSASSAAGPNGYSGLFFHKCWDIIQYDIMEYVQDFFRGKNLSKFYSHTCLFLIPKTDSPSNFSELRPISLSNFTCKILSNRLNPLLERLISENPSGFIKGRLINENVLLTQEIAHGIKQYNKGGNVIMKLNMAKAYDKMSWYFLMSVMKQFGFSRIWLDMIWRIIANVWYSILINGNRVGFFSSSHALKQGDPLSPSLFIIGSELLSRMLNSLNSHEHFTPFSMILNGPIINHLAFTDNIVIFSGGNNKSITLIKHQIRRNAHSDTMYHVLGEGEVARKLWSIMGNPLGIQHKNQPMANIFSDWWGTKSENDMHKTILKIIPTIICWEIWKQWCACKFGGQRYLQTNKMCYQAIGTIKSILANTFQNFNRSNHWPAFCLEV